MSRKNGSEKEKGLLPFAVIESAVARDPKAIMTVLRHYDSYIRMNSRRYFIKPNGESVLAVDDEIRDAVTAKLIDAVIKFKIQH